LRSVKSIVIAPAKTGNDVNMRITVTKMAQTNNAILSNETFLWCILRIVEIKLIAPKIEDIPAICKEIIVKSIEKPLWYVFEANGG